MYAVEWIRNCKMSPKDQQQLQHKLQLHLLHNMQRHNNVDELKQSVEKGEPILQLVVTIYTMTL